MYGAVLGFLQKEVYIKNEFSTKTYGVFLEQKKRQLWNNIFDLDDRLRTKEVSQPPSVKTVWIISAPILDMLT